MDDVSIMPRLVLVVPASTYRAGDFLEAGARVGVDVVVATDAALALPDAMGRRALRISLDDPLAAARAIVRHVVTGRIDGVVGVDDRGVEVAAIAADALSLRHNPVAAVRAARRKDAQRAAFTAAGVDQPDWVVAGPGDDVAALAARVGCPCVVKATTRSGSQGVIRAESPAEAARVAERVRSIVAAAGDDPGQPLMVEAFAPGDEVAVEGLLRDGELTVLAVFDKPGHPDGPTFEETCYVTPSRLTEPHLRRLHATVADAAAALGLREGPIHAEARVDIDGGRVRMLELAARTIGGLCGRSLRFGAGVALEELVLRHALDLPLPPPRRELAASGVLMLPIRQRGVLVGVDGVDAARAVDGVEGVELTITPGQELVPVPDGDRYLGFAFARGATPEDVEASLRAVEVALQVRVAPSAAEPTPLPADPITAASPRCP